MNLKLGKKWNLSLKTVSKKRRTYFGILGIILVLGLSLIYAPQKAHAAVVTWDGEGTDPTCGGGAGDGNKWSCGLNWTGDNPPGNTDVATFDNTSTKNATIDSNIDVQGIDINAGYTGIITQASGVTVDIGSSNYDQAAGTFTGGDSNIDIDGSSKAREVEFEA